MGYRVGKYRAQKCLASTGEKMDSKRERDRYEELLKLQEMGVIFDLKRQVKFELIPKQELPKPVMEHGRMRYVLTSCSYIADFTYRNVKGEYVIEDAKGVRTKDYQIKKKLMLQQGYQIMEV